MKQRHHRKAVQRRMAPPQRGISLKQARRMFPRLADRRKLKRLHRKDCRFYGGAVWSEQDRAAIGERKPLNVINMIAARGSRVTEPFQPLDFNKIHMIGPDTLSFRTIRQSTAPGDFIVTDHHNSKSAYLQALEDKWLLGTGWIEVRAENT